MFLKNLKLIFYANLDFIKWVICIGFVVFMASAVVNREYDILENSEKIILNEIDNMSNSI